MKYTAWTHAYIIRYHLSSNILNMLLHLPPESLKFVCDCKRFLFESHCTGSKSLCYPRIWTLWPCEWCCPLGCRYMVWLWSFRNGFI